jgi:hypothetical protein
MAAQTAVFNASGNRDGLPSTPFPFLYYDPSKRDCTSVQQGVGTPPGLLCKGTNIFNVPRGSFLYVPLAFADDSPPIIGTFPTSPSKVVNYWFESSQLGGSQSIVVDGQTTSVGMSYVVGPITTQPLPDGGGTHMVTVGVFLTPLTPGSHTVSIDARFDGAAVQALGAILSGMVLSFFEGRDTYTVNVQ